MRQLSSTPRIGRAITLCGMIFVLMLSLFALIFVGKANAASAYSYASNGSKISLKYNKTDYSLAKQPTKVSGKDAYTGSVKIAGKNGTQCMIGIQVLVPAGEATGSVSAPAFLNGIPGAGNAGQSYTESCPKDYASSQSEFNGNISIGGSSSNNTPGVGNPETEGQREINATVFSPIKDPPSASVTMTITGKTGTQKKNLQWSESNSVASAVWGNIDAGSEVKFCVNPITVFDTQNCKTATKERGKALVIQFGSFENSYSKDGKKVNVIVNISVAAAPTNTTYGPIQLTLYHGAGTEAGTTPTGVQTFGGENNGPTVQQPSSLAASFDGIEPGTYKVCIRGKDTLCSPIFEKKVNESVKTTINLTEEESKAFLANSQAVSSCTIEGIGWIVCPITNFLAGVSDGAFSVIGKFLQVNTKLLDTNNGTYAAWSAFRNIANVLFVIVFIIIIYSQLTGAGVSNYGVKKTLPRLVVAAILVNVSFIICQLAVDVTQIIGASIGDLLQGIPINAADPGAVTAPSGWTVIMDGVLGSLVGVGALAGVAVIGATVALSISVPVMLAFLLAVLMTVIILIGRQAGIVILIVLAPLAFVAFLLPNTEQWFKKWYKMFMALLMVYPIIAILYGGGQLASKIISSAAGDTTDGSQFWLAITAIGVSAVPLIMTPAILKGAMNATGTIGAKLSGIASKANGNVRKTANTSSRYGEAKQGLKNRFAVSNANRRKNSNFQKAIDRSPIGKALGMDKGLARAYSAIDKSADETRNASIAQIMHETSPTKRNEEAATILEEAIISGDVTRARAAQKVLLSLGGAGTKKLQEVYKKESVATQMARTDKKGEALADGLREDINSAGLKGKNNALATMGYTKTPLTDLLKSPGTYRGLTSVELAGQTAENLAMHETSISQESAVSVLTNPAAAALLNEDSRAMFQRIAGSQYATATSATGATGSASPTGRTTATQTTAQSVSVPIDKYTTATAKSQESAQQLTQIDPEWAQLHRQQGTDQTVIKVDHTEEATAGVLPAPQNVRDSQEQAREAAVAYAKAEQASAGNRGSTTDTLGRQTPNGTANPDAMHDYFQK